MTATTATDTWSAPSSNGSSLIGNAGRVSRNSAFTDVIQSWSAASWQTSRVLTGLPKGTVLYARVQARNTLSGIWVGDGTTWRHALIWVGDGDTWVLSLVKVGDGTAWK